jgi:hypothetical protein
MVVPTEVLIKRLTELTNKFRVQVLKRLISLFVLLFASTSAAFFGPVKYPSPRAQPET